MHFERLIASGLLMHVWRRRIVARLGTRLRLMLVRQPRRYCVAPENYADGPGICFAVGEDIDGRTDMGLRDEICGQIRFL